MAFNPPRSFKTPTFRSQLSVRRVYETLQPRSEVKETPEAHLLHVYLPGFTKDQMKIEFLDISRMLRITGERPIPGNKWRKFDQTYPVPENSEVETLEAKFEQGTLILKMQKKSMSQSQVAPKQEVEENTQEKSAQNPSNNLDETKVEKVQENIPPPQESTKDMKSDSRQTQSLEKKIENDDDKSSQISKEIISNNNPQKGQQEFEPKPTSIDTTKNQIDEKPQKSQEEFEPKTTSLETTKTHIDEKAQKGHEEFEPKIASIEKTNSQINEKTQKGEEEIEPKPMVTKEKLEENIVTKSDENAEKKVEEKNEKTYESSKTMKDVKNQNLKENEIEKKEHSPPNVSQNEKECCSRISPNQEGNKNGIRKFVAASSEFVTRIAEGKLNGEERHLVENVGAAFLVIAAFGAYVSFRFSS